MEHKGYLTETGRVVQRTYRPADPGHDASGLRLDSRGDSIIGQVFYKETRYNLRRLLVHREWVIDLTNGRRGGGSTRSEAVADALWKHTAEAGEKI